MTLLTALMDLRGRGLQLDLNGSDLKVSCAPGGLTPETHSYLRAHKATIRALFERLGITSTLDMERCSFGQERLWLLDRMAPGGVGYHMGLGLELQGALLPQALEAALQGLVQRHEVLRTVYRADETGQAVQVVLTQAQVALPLHDASAQAQPQQVLQALVHEQLQRPFDLERDVMLRALLVKLGDQHHVLLVTLHHIAADGWSMQILAHELGQLYEAHAHGRAAPLAPLALQYKDYARWQREQLQGPALQQQLHYWTQQLQALPAVHALPLDRPRTAQPVRRAAHVRQTLDAQLYRDMLALANAHGATLFMVLHAALAALLSRHSNAHDIVIGTPVANREQAEVAPLVGFFVNTLVLRSDLHADPSFEQLLLQSKQRLLQAYEHQQLPFEKLVDALQPERSLSHSPLFQVMLVLQNQQAAQPQLAGLQVRPLQLDSAQAKFDLTLDVKEGADGLQLDWEYAQELFDAASIERMAQRLQVLLRAALQAPQTAVSRLPLLTPHDRQLLQTWNDTDAPYPQDLCIHELIEQQVARNAQRTALQYEGRQLSYGQLNAQANQLARQLRQQGVGPDVLVGVCMHRSLEMVVALLGILKAGGAYVPLDPTLPAERIGYMLQDGQVPLLLTQQALQPQLQPQLQLLGLPLLSLDDPQQQQLLQALPGHDLPRQGLQPQHLAYVIYTSGSTGRPKGVMNEHGAVVNRLHWMQQAFALDGSDAVLQKTPYGFDVSVWEFFWPLMHGARLVVARPDGHKDPEYLAALIDAQAVNTLHFVPSMLQAFVTACAQWQAAGLRQVFCSGEALPPALRDRFLQLWPHVQLHNLYGPTEAAVDVTWHACSEQPQRPVVPIGKPIANTHMHVLDAHLQPQPVGVVGELHIGGVQVARGYLGQPQLTAQRFIADPFSQRPGARLYKTGDLGRWLHDGQIEYLGRNDFQVKIRGLRIELGEIEAVLREHPQVVEATVLARDEPLRLVAYVVAQPDASIEPALREHLHRRLPEYMVPSAFAFLPSLPLSPNGKLDRKALPDPGRNATVSGHRVPPQGPLETELCAMWCELLRLDAVGVTDRFFALGGHSLLAMRMAALVAARWGTKLAVRDVFEHDTVRALARCLASRPRVASTPEVRPGADRGPVAPCSFGQERLWLLDRMAPGGVGYHMGLGLELQGALLPQALEAALQGLVQRHEVLRTVYRADETGQAVQVVLTQAQVALPLHDASAQAQPQQVLQALVHEQLQRPFDLERDVMLRALLVKLGDQHHVLLVTLHHIAADGWSMQILAHELGQLYEAHAHGRAAPLAPLALQYKDYARWQREQLQGPALQQQLHYWTQQLQALPAVHALPLDRPRTAQPVRRAAHVRQTLDAQLYRDMLALANAHGATLFMVLHAALAALLSRHSNAHDIVIGTPVANREQAEVAPLVGFFVNTLVLRSDLHADPSFEQLLLQSKQRLLQAYEHQQLPFEKLVDALQPERSLSHSPLFQVMLVLQNQQAAQPQLAGLQVRPLQLDSAQAKFDLTLDVKEGADGLQLDWEYAQELFDAASIERMAQRLQVLLRAALQAPQTAVSRLPLLTPHDRQLLQTWNDTDAPYPQDLCIHELIEQQVARNAQRTALQYEGRQLSYGQLNAQANQLARQLRQQGVGPDVLVGVCMHRSLEMVVALLGILKAGGAYVPLDPTLPAERIGYMLQDGQVPLLLTQQALQPQLQPQLQLLGLPLLSLDDPQQQQLLQALPGHDLPRQGLQPQHLAYVIYTSGSTGRPKGVMNEHGAVVNRLHWMQQAFALDGSDAVLQKTPYGFDVSVWEFFWPLMHGARLVVARPDGHKDPEYLAALIDAQAVNTLHFVPSMLQAFVTACAQWQAAGLRQVFCSGEALPPALRDRFLQLWPHVQLHNLYGPTEAAVDVTWHACSEQPQRPVVPIGKPIANTHMHVLDAHLQPQPVGVVGELHIGGVQVARGYLGQPQLTAQRFIADPFSQRPGARLYKTGDLGRWLHDGQIEYLGRNDFQVKIRGLRIELGEIEAVLREHPQVVEATVLARDEPLRLVAYVVAQPDASIEPALREHLHRRLPEYMVPSAFAFLPSLPLSPNGKLDRKALPDPGRNATPSVGEPPRGETELELAVIWQRLLRRDGFGREQSFFDVGGHSLLALKLLDEIRRKYGLALPAPTLFRHQTIAQLAACITGARGLTRREPAVTAYQEGDARWVPLVVVHPIGGSSLCYSELLQRMHYRGPVWTVQQDRDLNAAESTGTVEGLARLYVDDAQALGVPRAVCLLGWSFGGVLAFEMAREWERRGVQVRWLGLIDSQARWPDMDLTVDEESVLALARNIGIGADTVARLREAGHGTLDQALDGLLAAGRALGVLPEAVGRDELDHWHALTAANLARMRRYNATPWNGNASYYQARAGTGPAGEHPVWQWTPLLSSMEIFGLDADHFEIVKGGHAQALARLVNRALAERARK